MEENKNTEFVLRLLESDAKELMAIAKGYQISRSALIRMILKSYLDSRGTDRCLPLFD